MNIEGSVALVTGANRGLGKAYVDALLAAGAATVYAGARDPSTITDPRVTPIRVDVTNPDHVAAAAARCTDVTLLINNAGTMVFGAALAGDAEARMRNEFEVNVFGVHRMMTAFAPILAANGGGAIANMLSVVSWYVYPFNATYCASKHAAKAITDGARYQLRSQGTHVVGVYAGFIDTDMADGVSSPKTPPSQVAEATLDGIRHSFDHVCADESAETLQARLRADPSVITVEMQQAWDAATSSGVSQ
jgi:NAD(P)-dependent dehydrogenase (short-subunit alcohol dehydrogenase family)